MKRFLGLILTVILAFSLIGCGDKGDSHGETIDSEQAMVMLDQIKLAEQNITAESLSKFTYTATITMDDATLYTVHKFSKEDNYIFFLDTILNMDLYEGYEEPYKIYYGTTNFSHSKNYLYVNSQGQLIDANHYSCDEIMKNDQGVFEEKRDWYQKYEIKKDNLEESIQTFRNDCLTQLSDFMAQWLSYSSQMFSTFEPLIEMGNMSYGGMDIEIKSNGEGHLYMSEDMSSMGMSYECEYTDYMLTYVKTEIDNTKMGLTATGYDKITTEIRFSMGLCDFEYPDLSQYELVE